MSSVKKTDKSTKTKAGSSKTERSPALKSKAAPRSAPKLKKVASTATGGRAAVKAASKKTAPVKAKTAAKSASRTRIAAPKPRTITATASSRGPARGSKTPAAAETKIKATVRLTSPSSAKKPVAAVKNNSSKAATQAASARSSKNTAAAKSQTAAAPRANVKSAAPAAKVPAKVKAAAPAAAKTAAANAKLTIEKKKPAAAVKTAVPAAKAAAVPAAKAAAKPASAQLKASATLTSAAIPGQSIVLDAGAGSMDAGQKPDAVTLNLAAAKVTAAVSSPASLAESSAAALKKAAEKNMSAKLAKTPAIQAMEPILPEDRIDAKSSLAKAPEVKTAAKPAPHKPALSNRPSFKVAEFIVYPAHGVGQIVTIEDQEVAGFKLELYVISFIKDKMILKVPTTKVAAVGMRKLAEADVVKKALTTLTGRARIKRTMWSRRAQEYEAKINSGDLGAIAEVVRDLYRSDAQPEQSYSERQLYEAALDRLSREVGTVQKLTETESLKLIEAQLQKGPRRGKAEEADAEADGDGPDSEDGDIEEAA